MSVILISSDSLETGQKIAENTANALEYKLVGREILATVSQGRGIPEDKLVKALDEAPSFMGMSSKIRDRCLTYIQEAVLAQLDNDGIVCHGLAAHLYVHGVSHVLKARILHDQEEWARQIASLQNIPPEKARRLMKREEKLRRRWSLEAFKLDETDPGIYDLVISLSQIDAEKAVEVITDMAGYRKFTPMTYSIKSMHDRVLASKVRAELLERFPDIRVQSRDGTVVVWTKSLKREKYKKAAVIKEIVGKIPGVDYVEVHTVKDIFREAAESSR